ncbi:MAG: DUF1343 domain-containing protein [Bacteroidales bacterium]|nr:DUF1343 domain-containing protein [Bacteroidales bacterium]
MLAIACSPAAPATPTITTSDILPASQAGNPVTTAGTLSAQTQTQTQRQTQTPVSGFAIANTLTTKILPGASQTAQYLPLLQGKRIGFVANHTSLIDGRHAVDSLLQCGINIRRIFSPEHGFRGTADAGETVSGGTDAATGLQIVSLYGNHKKPTSDDMFDIDLMVFDLQDVGARFYTYISTLHYVMEACAENQVPLVVLDRPNPNGQYIDGPVLEPDLTSFVGMHPVPVIYGMTIGEYARMINGEGWLAGGRQCQLQVIPCRNYTHASRYDLPVPPSPNLQTPLAIALYPSLCFFEGTPLSVGRGTDFPFMAFGHPDLQAGDFRFTPQSTAGAKNPPLLGRECRGTDLRTMSIDDLYAQPGLRLEWILFAYRNYPQKSAFFTSYFDTLAGTHTLREQISAGLSEEDIKASWEPGLEKFKSIRIKYLIYD